VRGALRCERLSRCGTLGFCGGAAKQDSSELEEACNNSNSNEPTYPPSCALFRQTRLAVLRRDGGADSCALRAATASPSMVTRKSLSPLACAKESAAAYST
jgi:hypothetical protein